MSMRINLSLQTLTVILPVLLLSGWNSSVAAAVGGFPGTDMEKIRVRAETVTPLFLVENGNDGRESTSPAPGSLVLPDESKVPEENTGEKKCMTVCARWGEECQYINRGAGGLSKKCRRACKQFTEECF